MEKDAEELSELLREDFQTAIARFSKESGKAGGARRPRLTAAQKRERDTARAYLRKIGAVFDKDYNIIAVKPL